MGIFRKAGVKSRIAKLRTVVEAAGAANAPFAIENLNTLEEAQCSLSFDGAQAHDVADMVKQYFRELPDALLTNKLSETFIAIFQRKYAILPYRHIMDMVPVKDARLLTCVWCWANNFGT